MIATRKATLGASRSPNGSTTPDPGLEKLRRAYAELWRDFEEWTPSDTFRRVFARVVVAEVRRRLAGGGRVRIIEAGCGHGTWAEELFQALSADGDRIDYLGLDFVEPRIRLARQRLGRVENASFELADAAVFDPDGPVDIVLAIEVLCHLTPRQHAQWMRRWQNWLRPGGCFIVIDKDGRSRHALRFRWDRLKRRCLPARLRGRLYYFPERFGQLVDTLRYPNFDRLRAQAARCGYRVRPIHADGIFRALTADIGSVDRAVS